MLIRKSDKHCASWRGVDPLSHQCNGSARHDADVHSYINILSQVPTDARRQNRVAWLNAHSNVTLTEDLQAIVS